MKIGSALLIVMMIVYLLPRARHMLAESRAAEQRDWGSVILPLGAVVLFVALLLWSVR